MVKKFLIFSITFLSSFLVIDKINAQTAIPITTYTNQYYYYNEWLALRENDGYTTYHNDTFEYQNIDSNTGNVNFVRFFNYGILESDTNYIFYKSETYNPGSSTRTNWTGWFVVSKSDMNYFYIDAFLKDGGAMGIRVIISTQEIVIDKNTNLPILTDNSTSGFWRHNSNYFDYYNDNEYKAAWNINRIRQNYFTNYNVMYSDNTIFAEKNSSVEPDFEFSYYPNEVNDYITSVRFLVTLNYVDDENYNYFYKFGEVVDWYQLYSENFINNTFSQLIKRNGIFYFKITDKENNVIVTKTFSINNINTSVKPSIEYDPDYITEYDTITSVNLLTYFYVYADENYICQQKFVDTSQNFNDVDFTTYSCDSYHLENITSNGSVYSRILLNNNIVYSSTYTIFNIGSLSPESDLNFFDRIGKSLNYGGPISNLITIPVQILQTVYSSFIQTCKPVSLGSLFGHELSIPCIDIKSILGDTLYNLIDLICAFYVSSNIIGFILNTYNKLMDLHPNSLDSQKGKGGIFR